MSQLTLIMIQKHKKHILNSKLKRGDKISTIKPYDSMLEYGFAMFYYKFTEKKYI